MENRSPEIDDIMGCNCQAPVNFVSNYVFENSNGGKVHAALVLCTGCQKLVRISGPINRIDDLALNAYNRM